jgi:diguanylate cyclase (GGDEF)-like protein/PAS domain S-box-containing protein
MTAVLLPVHRVRAVQVAGLSLLSLGCVVLWGWAAENATLVRVWPGLPAMMPNTAVGFVLLGVALILSKCEVQGLRHVSRLAAWAAAALGLATLAEYVTGADIGVDRALFGDRTGAAPIPGRMALATAMAFTLAGCGLVLLRRASYRAAIAGQAFALGVVALASANLFGFFYEAQSPSRLAAFSSMAFHTTLGFLVMAAAMLALRPGEGLMRDLTADTLGSAMLRWLLPGALLLPALVGYVMLHGQWAGGYGTEFGLALFATVQSALWAAGLWLVSRWLTEADQARRDVARENERLIVELRRAAAGLEGTVALRTRELSESESKFRSLIALTTDWYWEQDENLRFSQISPEYERQTGLPAARSLGKTRFETPGLFESEEQRARHQADLEARRPFRDLRLSRVTPTGEVRFLSVSGEPVFDSHGRFRGYRGVGRDITAEEKTERNRQLLASIVEHTHDAVISRTLDGTILSWNKGAERIYGYTVEEALGKNAADVLFGSDHSVLERQNQRLLGGEEGLRTVDERRTKRGMVLVLSIMISATKDRAGRVVGAVSVARDVSDVERAHRALEESDRRLTLAMGIAQVETWELDLPGGAMRCSDGVGPILGRPRGFQFVNRLAWRETIHPEDRQRVADLFDAAVADGVDYYVEFRVLRSDGSEAWVLSRCVFERGEDGRPVRAIGVMLDITERRRFEEQLSAEKELAQVTLRSIGDAVITADASGVVTDLNPVAEKLTRWPAAQAKGRPLREVFRLEDVDGIPLADPAERVLLGGIVATVEDEAVLVAHDGSRVSIADSAAPIYDARGRLMGAVVVFHDVTEQRRVARELRFHAAHDALTGLINRREFELRVTQALERGSIDSVEHALCYIDLDQFKIVNDTCGHAAGDELLRQVAQVLHAHVRRGDTLARLGGDEFGLLLENCPKAVATRITQELLDALRGYRFAWGDQLLRIGGSIGVAMIGGSRQTLAQVLSLADAACYAAKEAGRNRVKFYDDHDQALTQRRGEMGLVSRIHGALDEGRMALFAQPIVALRGGRRRYCEVLVRMREPGGRLMEPGTFIPAAERYGLMPRLDQWVVQQVLAHAQRVVTHEAAALSYSVNLSAMSLSQDGMLEWLTTLIAEHPLPPGTLCFELTETAAVSNLTLARDFIGRLKSLGCAFALDDFGSGMSSFGYLRHLGVDFVKIDGSFVADAVSDPVSRVMVEAINRVGHSMGVGTIAEWVEDAATLALMREVGVDYVQGYGVARPQPLDELLAGAAAPQT